MFIFQTSFCQKLKLTITSTKVSDVLSSVEVHFPAESLIALLKEKRMHVPNAGSIEDKGVIGKIRIFVYKFDETVECSKATSYDFNLAVTRDKFVIPPSATISRNVGWSFYSLSKDCKRDILKDFEAADRGQLKRHYIYEEPTAESQRIECLQTTIADNYGTNKEDSLTKVWHNSWKFDK